MTDKICNSCKSRILNTEGFAIFMCPNCGKEEIARCGHCREIASKYTCSSCGFSGPN